MATGIVSIAALSSNFHAVAFALFWVNITLLIYFILLALTNGGVLNQRNKSALTRRRIVELLALPTALSVLGSQVLFLWNNPSIAFMIWVFAAALWAFLTYSVLLSLAALRQKLPSAETMNGTTLLLVVSAQAVSTLSCELSRWMQTTAHAQGMLFFALIVWLSGCMLYLWIITLIFFRLEFIGIKPADLAPAFWINMGATAISALAGNSLSSHFQSAAFLAGMLPFIKGLTLLFWATATWWLPFLFSAEIWRYSQEKITPGYDQSFWSLVFPLGMYAFCTHEIAGTLNLNFLLPVSFWAAIVAITAWTLVFIAMILENVFHLFPSAHSTA